MKNKIYQYSRIEGTRYTFTSVGKRRIVKQVIFTPTGIRNIINMGFGDLMPDGTIDDKVNSNNGDIVRVLATTVEILSDFISIYPNTRIFFAGSTKERTRLYARILKTYYPNFSKQFIISVLVEKGDAYSLLPFEAKADLEYSGFLIERIH
jgi:hypothetical protein